MTRDEIITALRCCASPEVDCKGNCAFFGASSPNEDCSQKKNTAAADLIEKLAADRKALLNELCQYCKKYKQAHEGTCDGCRWREM